MQSDYTVQRFRGGFAVVWNDPDTGKRRRYQLQSEDRASARAEARKWWAASSRPSRTVGHAIEAYLNAREAEGMITIQRRRDAWKAMKHFWAKVDMGAVDVQMCKDYRATRDVADGTARLELMLLSNALGYALGNDKPKLWLPPKGERKVRHLEREDFHKFLGGVRAPHHRLYIMLGIFTLARPSALLQLQWTQVDFRRGLIDLNPPGRKQTAKRRPVVPMNAMLREELEKAYELRDSQFVISLRGEQIESIKRSFQLASERSGIHATPYTLRHTGAVWAAEQGVPMSELAQMMGHEDSRTTEQHYARYSPKYLRGVADAVESAFKVQSEPQTPVSLAA